MTVAEYLRRKEAINNTTFIIKAEGAFFLVEGQLIAERDFLRQHELPLSLLTHDVNKVADTRNSWLAS